MLQNSLSILEKKLQNIEGDAGALVLEPGEREVAGHGRATEWRGGGPLATSWSFLVYQR